MVSGWSMLTNCSFLDARMQCSLQDGRDAFRSGSYIPLDVGGMILTTFVCGLWDFVDFVDFVEPVSALTLFSPQLPPGAASSPETIQIHVNTSHRHLIVLINRAKMLQRHANTNCGAWCARWTLDYRINATGCAASACASSPSASAVHNCIQFRLEYHGSDINEIYNNKLYRLEGGCKRLSEGAKAYCEYPWIMEYPTIWLEYPTMMDYGKSYYESPSYVRFP